MGILLQPTKGKMLEKLGKPAFQAAAPHLWNELPLQLIKKKFSGNLKNLTRTFLFRQIFREVNYHYVILILVMSYYIIRHVFIFYDQLYG